MQSCAKALGSLTGSQIEPTYHDEKTVNARIRDAWPGRWRPAEPPAPAELDPAAQFREAIGPVTEIHVPESLLRAEKPLPRALMFERDEAAVLDELLAEPSDPELLDGAQHLAYLGNGCSPKLLRKLRRGQFRVSDEFDLHHIPAEAARKALHQFLHQARDREQLCLRVIHGKGLRSGARGPVLKSMVDHELRRRKDVLAFVSAPAAQGGTGAVLILLKR